MTLLFTTMKTTMVIVLAAMMEIKNIATMTANVERESV